ncbi:MAG TPA: hypothetical protein VJ948_02745 [Acidimicrobiia bacterium]|nr:hypothetical protein [Acidimicrobiia bacterium]
MSLLVGTGAGLFSVGDQSDEIVGGTRINHVVRDGDGWWAVDGKRRVHHDGEVIATLPDGAAALCVQPTPETVWVGSSEARLFGVDDHEIAEDEFFAEAPGRDSWYTPWGAPADIRSMTLDADHTLYVNVHVGGILRYDDTGPVPTLDISADVHQVTAHPTEKGAIFAASARGLALSHNGHDFDFRADGLHAGYCRAVAVSGDRLLVSASTGPSTSRGRVYTGELWDGPLTPVGAGLPDWFGDNVDTHCLLLDDGVAHIGHDDTVWRSEDWGETWAELAGGLPRITSIA